MTRSIERVWGGTLVMIGRWMFRSGIGGEICEDAKTSRMRTTTDDIVVLMIMLAVLVAE
jgi:hypothetical protein